MEKHPQVIHSSWVLELIRVLSVSHLSPLSSFLCLLECYIVSKELDGQRRTMGLGYKMSTTMRLGLLPQFQPPFTGNSSPSCCSSSFRGKEAYLESTKLTFTSVILVESDVACKDSFRVYTCLSSALQISEIDYADMESAVNNLRIPNDTEKSLPITGALSCNQSCYQLLMENVNVLEKKIANSNSMELERDILVQLGRLGALELFRTCLSRTVTNLLVSDKSCKVDELSGDDNQVEDKADCHLGKIVVRSRKKGKRRSKRSMAMETREQLSLESVDAALVQPSVSSVRKRSKTSITRSTIAKNEAELSCGVKVVANLERIREALEKETGKEVTLSSWAEAAGINEKQLQQRLHFGWHCRDELITSAQSLVLYLARSYKGLGIASEDLVQVGNIGVLQGAIRFDPMRGYKFSTYVQYWIRKAMSKFVARHARGVKMPSTLSSAISSIQKARKALQTSCGRCPNDIEVAKLTGLSLERIQSASKCFRVVGSTDQKIKHWSKVKFLECTLDVTVDSPERTVMRKHMKKDIMKLLNDLEPKERKVLILRYGFGGHQRKSLHEIGKLFNVSKEWIRRVEKRALAKLRDEKNQSCLRQYIDL